MKRDTVNNEATLAMMGFRAEWVEMFDAYHLTDVDDGFCLGTAWSLASAVTYFQTHWLVHGSWPTESPTTCPICGE